MAYVKKMNYKRGFTLIEVVAVLVILSICGALLKVVFSYRNDSIKINVAKQELALLNCVLENIKLEEGSYPTCKSKSIEDNAASLYSALSNRLKTMAMEHSWIIKDGKILDPWGHPYVYRCESPTALTYILFSMGPNGYVDENELIDDMYSR